MTELGAPRMTCIQTVELLSDYLEGTLPPREQARVEAHLDTCPECTAYLAQLRATVRALGRLRVDDVPRPLLERFAAAFRGWKLG